MVLLLMVAAGLGLLLLGSFDLEFEGFGLDLDPKLRFILSSCRSVSVGVDFQER